MRYYLVVIAMLFVTICQAGTATANNDSIWLVYASHMADVQKRGNAGGYAELKTLISEMRAKHDNVLLLHGGNCLGPSALSSYDKGAHIVGILNLLEPDVLGVGRRDFMYKEDELILRSGEAVYPVVCSNIFDPLTHQHPSNVLHNYTIDISDISLGFISLVSPEIQTTYIQQRVKVAGGYDILPKLASELRDKNIDFVAATADFIPASPQEIIASSGIDLLFFSESRVTELIMYGDQGYITHNGNSSDVLVIEMKPVEVQGEKKLRVASHQVVELSSYAPDAQVQAALERYNKVFESLMKVTVGVIQTPVDTTTTTLRTGENAMGNLLTDAMRDYYKADISIINSGGIRGNRKYDAGITLTRGDLQAELPLHDMSCLINVKGSVLLAALEHGVSEIEKARGKFLQVSGIQYTYDPSAPSGSRITSVTLNNAPLSLEKVYSISLPEYIAENGDGFYMMPGQCELDALRPSQELVEIARDYIANHSPVAPVIEGRIATVK